MQTTGGSELQRLMYFVVVSQQAASSSPRPCNAKIKRITENYNIKDETKEDKKENVQKYQT